MKKMMIALASLVLVTCAYSSEGFKKTDLKKSLHSSSRKAHSVAARNAAPAQTSVKK